MDKALVPCKLCGGPVGISKEQHLDGYCHYDNWLIRCFRCKCTYELPADGYYGRNYYTEEEAVSYWNRYHGGENYGNEDRQPDDRREV